MLPVLEDDHKMAFLDVKPFVFLCSTPRKHPSIVWMNRKNCPPVEKSQDNMGNFLVFGSSAEEKAAQRANGRNVTGTSAHSHARINRKENLLSTKKNHGGEIEFGVFVIA